MDTQAFNIAKAAYQAGDWNTAALGLAAAKAPGELNGEADHLRGNALMKLGNFTEAAEAYGLALADASYAHVGALNCNRGRALVAAGQSDAAAACFQAAVADPSYATPYKAYVALGNVYTEKGMVAEAASAWRAAAIDESNPEPSTSLVKLGDCFMQLSRPNDAVDAYRTALDFSTGEGVGSINALLGQAYMAQNRLAEAADAFAHAAADPSYQLTEEQQSAYTAAQRALTASNAGGPSETDQMLSAAGYGDGAYAAPQAQAQPDALATTVQPQTAPASAYDPLDPMGRSGEFIPSPEDTGFFSVTEEDLMKADKKERKARRKHNHRGLKVFLVILILVLLLAGGGVFAYFNGYGWPTQEAVVSDLFSTASAGNDISGYLSSSVTDDAKSDMEAIMPRGATSTVSGVDRSMASSEVLVTASLASGGTQDYTVTLVRDGLGWKVTGVTLTYASASDATASTSAVTSSSVDDSVSSDVVSSDGTSAEASSSEETTTEEQPSEETSTEEQSSEAEATAEAN